MRYFAEDFLNKEQLPLVLEPTQALSFSNFLQEIQHNQEVLKEKILKYGGVLFRNFPVEGADAFNAVVDALGLGKPISYVGGDTPRSKVKGKVYTSTEAPPSLLLPLHNEMSFINNYPKHIYFYCDVEPQLGGGETTIADARAVYRAVDAQVRDRFIQKELRYISNFYGKSKLLDVINRYVKAHKNWMDALETADKKEAEKRCLENDFDYQWMKNEWLQIVYKRPSTLIHPVTGENVWFNQAHLYDYNIRLMGFWKWLGTKLIYMRKNTVMHEIYFGDKSKVSQEDLYHVMDVLEQKTIKFPWKKGDVMVLDNILTMHGRAPYKGKRRILVSLTR